MKIALQSLFILSLLGMVGATAAAPVEDACLTLRSARIHLVAFMGARNEVSQTNHRHQIQEASARLDGILAAMVQGANAEDASRAKAFQPVWEAFKKTREEEIIPAVHAGKLEQARQLALGVQGERMQRMKSAMGCR